MMKGIEEIELYLIEVWVDEQVNRLILHQRFGFGLFKIRKISQLWDSFFNEIQIYSSVIIKHTFYMQLFIYGMVELLFFFISQDEDPSIQLYTINEVLPFWRVNHFRTVLLIFKAIRHEYFLKLWSILMIEQRP